MREVGQHNIPEHYLIANITSLAVAFLSHAHYVFQTFPLKDTKIMVKSKQQMLTAHHTRKSTTTSTKEFL